MKENRGTRVLSAVIVAVLLLIVVVCSQAVMASSQPQLSSPTAPYVLAALGSGELPASVLPAPSSDSWEPIPISSEVVAGDRFQITDNAPAVVNQASWPVLRPCRVVTRAEFDDADSHKWIGEPWGDPVEVNWVEFDSRKVLSATVTSAVKNWALMRTDAFPPEDWEDKIGLRADIYQDGGASGIDIKLEVRDSSHFDDLIEAIYCWNLQPDTWNTCTWNFNTTAYDYSTVSYLSMVFDHLGNTAPVTFYVDNLRLVSPAGEEEWDDMDDSSRWWFYFGNWYNWKPLGTPFGLEPISHNGGNPTTPAGSIYLQWDYENGLYPGTTAEVGTSKLDDLNDWSGYNRISADVKVSDPDVPISVFLWDEDTSTGLGTPTRRAGVADEWITLTWDLPWPSWFDSTDIDEIKFVVNDIDEHLIGTLYLDNIYLTSDTCEPLAGLDYILEDFNDRNDDFNDFYGNWGLLNSGEIAKEFDAVVYTGTWGASLKVNYGLSNESFAGVWQSLWGDSDYTQTQYLDFTNIYGDLNEPAKDFEQIHFWVRGSGMTSGTHNIKIELKDNTGDFDRTAYRYVAVDDSDPTWRKVVLDADVTNPSFWSYNDQPPDPTRMKQLVFIVESFFNSPSGTFYVDDIRFVDVDDAPFDLEQHTDEEFLDLVSERTFLYFLDWYDPNTGLFQHTATYPDLTSPAATGYGLTALAIGESRGWISRTLATKLATRTLQTLRDRQIPTLTGTLAITGTNGYRGFFYRFLDDSGLRKDLDTELSILDTAILMAGVLTVREHFDDVPDIVNLADEIYLRAEWDWILDTDNNWFYKAWKPECGANFEVSAPGGGCFSDSKWHYYSDEAILINLLAIGSPTYPVSEEVFYAWSRVRGAYADHSLIQTEDGTFLSYSLADLWVDFSRLGADNHPTPTLRADWWDNSVEAAWAHWHFAADHQDDDECDGDNDYITYGERSWGLTGAEGPDGGYHSYGAPPAAALPEHDGTIPPYGAGMATMFLPDLAIPALKHYFANTDLWRNRFGFGDAYNLDPPDCSGHWYNHVASGIHQGPLLISAENHRSGLIRNTVTENGYVRQALHSIGQPLWVPIDGPMMGALSTTYTYTATVSPVTATTPITYVWQATGQSPMTHTGELSDTAAFSWTMPGTQAVTVTATSADGIGTGIHLVDIGCPTVARWLLSPRAVGVGKPVAFGAAFRNLTGSGADGTLRLVRNGTVLQSRGISITTGPHAQPMLGEWMPSLGDLGANQLTLEAEFVGCPAYASDPFTLTVVIAPTSVDIHGPTMGITQSQYVFTSTAGPITTTQPITYVWQAAGQSPVTHIGGLSDTTTFTWDVTGIKMISVTAGNAGGEVSDIHLISVSDREPVSWTVMVYLNGDNDLDEWTAKLFNRLEKAVASDPSLAVRVLWDRIFTETVLYDVLPDTHRFALADYVEGETKWSKGELDMGAPETLWNFIVNASLHRPAEHYLFAAVNHGGGWSPELLPSQAPTSRYAGGGASGFSWDWTNGFNYLSTHDLGEVFSQVELVFNPIDIVFYDACLMGMVEEAYEIRQGARYFVASQNDTWTSFPYDDYLAGIRVRTPEEQAVWMVNRYSDSLSQPAYPHTMAAIDLELADELSTALDTLAIELSRTISTHKAEIQNAFLESQKFNYNYDKVISDTEGYVDLGDFATKLISECSSTEIAMIAESVLNILSEDTDPMLVHECHLSGGSFGNLDGSTGLSIYMPFGEPDPGELGFYINSQLAFARATRWDEFVFAFLGKGYPEGTPDSSGGRGDDSVGPGEIYYIYLPTVMREK